MLKPEWTIVQEPVSPQAAKRMSAREKQFLLSQRHLEAALNEGNSAHAVTALLDLGLHDAAFEQAETLEDLQRVSKRLKAETAQPCHCPKVQHPVTEWANGQRVNWRKSSNFVALRKLPQGTLYGCVHCPKQFVSTEPPDELTRQLEMARAEFPAKGEGPDPTVLPNA